MKGSIEEAKHAITPVSELAVVGDNHGGEGMFATKPVQQGEKVGGGRVIKVARGLVGKQDLWAGHKSAGDGDALLLAPGELAGAMRGTGGKLNAIQP